MNQPSCPLDPEPHHKQLVPALRAAWTKWADEFRTASVPCCAGTSDSAGGSAVAGLDPDAGLIAAPLVAALLVLAPA